ncbi:hypothetical protein KOR42_05790 [Thalassoglobus neptunius]|uniref:Uncharacterized protein n=1 Tax=Thalassoglobus neptunius TaxID=1938619 RepID=A0A5C5X4G8_9PLAN|nr:hypothetical protein [Thalassoglobus neptunius]TWT57221.1 hypothetical protein KOR42_05790 [Thalassoglobus neptunius]
MTTALTTSEKRTLEACELDIEKGASMVGRAMQTIRDDRLYRATHKTFEAYCQERWKISRQHAHNKIAHTEVVAAITDQLPEMSTMVDKIPERATRQIRDLEPEQQAKVIEVASKQGTQVPTSKAVASAKEQLEDFLEGDDEEETEEAPSPSIILDDCNRSVPDHLSAHYELGARIASCARTLDATLRELNELGKLPGSEFLHVADLETRLRAAKKEIRDSRYWTACPRCDGSGKCDLCGFRRFIPVSSKGLLTQPEKDVLKCN